MATQKISSSVTITSVTSLAAKDITILRASLDAYKKTAQLAGQEKKDARKKVIHMVHNELKRQHSGISKVDWEMLKMVRPMTRLSNCLSPL